MINVEYPLSDNAWGLLNRNKQITKVQFVARKPRLTLQQTDVGWRWVKLASVTALEGGL